MPPSDAENIDLAVQQGFRSLRRAGGAEGKEGQADWVAAAPQTQHNP